MRGWLAGAAAMVLALGMTAGVPARARNLAGRELAETADRAGRTVKLVGLGLREKYFFDVYVVGVYTESGTCDRVRMVKDDEPKLLRMEFLRKVPAKRLQEEVRKMVSTRVPESATEADRQQSETFIAMYDFDVTKETVVELLYVPGVGTTATRDGKPMGPVLPGKAFQETLWSTYVGPEPCCPATTRGILESCPSR